MLASELLPGRESKLRLEKYLIMWLSLIVVHSDAPTPVGLPILARACRKWFSLFLRVIEGPLVEPLFEQRARLFLFLQPLFLGHIYICAKVREQFLVDGRMLCIDRLTQVFQLDDVLSRAAHQLGIRGLRDEWCLDLLATEFVEVNPFKEWVAQNLVAAIYTESFSFIFKKQFLNYIPGHITNADSIMALRIGPFNFSSLYVEEHDIPILVIERRDTSQHLVDENT